MDAMQWIIAAAAAVSAGATIVLTGITARYARTSALMLEEMKRTRDLAAHPLLTFTFHTNPMTHAAAIGSVTVRNVGNAPALRTLFDMSLKVGGKYFGEMDYGVYDLGAGEAIEIPCGDALYRKDGSTRLLAQQQALGGSPIEAFVRLRYNNSLFVQFERSFTMLYDKTSTPSWELAEERVKTTPWTAERALNAEPTD